MTDPLLYLAIATVRGWTRLYTCGVDAVSRDRRRAEIESDIWEFHEDARHRRHSPAAIAVHMLARLIAGVPDDVLWRLESLDEPTLTRHRAAWRTAGAAFLSTCYAVVWGLALIAYFLSMTPLPDSSQVEHRLLRSPARSASPGLPSMHVLPVGRSASPVPPPPLPPSR